MCCCDACLEIGVEALKRLGDFVAQNCRNRKKYETVHQNEKHNAGDGVKNGRTATVGCEDDELHSNAVINPKFSDGTNRWYGEGCSVAVESHDGSSYCIAHGRNETGQGLAQDIGKRLEGGVEYRVEAWVGMRGGQAEQALVRSTVKVEKTVGGEEEVILLASVTVKRGQWSLLKGNLRVGDELHEATLLFDGPIGGIDILVSSVAIVPISTVVPRVETDKADDELHIVDTKLNKLEGGPPDGQVPIYGRNIITNSSLWDELDNWYTIGTCSMSVETGAPTELGACLKMSLFNCVLPELSGNYIFCSDRSDSYEGPAQDITGKIQLFQTYQVSAWVATCLPDGSEGTLTPQRVSMSLEVDGQWVQGGEVAAVDEWIEVAGSFRLEVEPKKVIFYVQGPDPGVNVKLSGLQIFAVDRLARVPILRHQAEQVRMRDVVLRVRNSHERRLHPGTKISVRQTKIGFPIGTCISRVHLEDDFYRQFFLDHFTWAVFENALKWDQIEPEDDDVSYRISDYLIKFCQANKIPMRGHCIVWEAEQNLPEWLDDLDHNDLLQAVKDRVNSLVERYKGQFKQFDVNNEILHGSFFEDRLGKDIFPYMFELVHKLDSQALLFLNEYNVEDGYDFHSAPEVYIRLVKFLLENGAPVGGLGVQGHIKVPVGPIISQALKQLSTLDIPIWFTEVDVSSLKEEVRADDLEVMMREAFACPGVEGFMLWGFLEGDMSRENAHLVDKDYNVNDAGQRFLDVKKEWTTHFEGRVDSNNEVVFRGYHGSYTLEVHKGEQYDFEVEKGDGYMVIDLS